MRSGSESSSVRELIVDKYRHILTLTKRRTVFYFKNITILYLPRIKL